MEILHHGAADGVTGSCHQLRLDTGFSLLVDCGLFQGADTSPGRAGAGSLDIEFDLAGIRALVATHVHIDHVGRIPYLLAAGFSGPILCSEPSARLLPIVLEDAFRLGISRDQHKVEQYLALVERRLIALPYNRWFTLSDTSSLRARIRLRRAGHVLGSAYVEVDIRRPGQARRRVLFSGDLGAPHAPLLRPPQVAAGADVVVLESTYGDRQHEDRTQRRQRLKRLIEKALADDGSVLIPAFSIGRTQELLYELEQIIFEAHAGAGPASGAGWRQLPIILDSPLASRFTEAYRELRPFWNDEAQGRLREGRDPMAFDQLLTVDSHDQHLSMVRHLAETARPAVVIAGGGMCAGGRIVNYLKAMLEDRRHNVLFVGYQAAGTPGHAIQRFGPRGGYVELDGQRLDIRAGIESIGGYSAHADRNGLLGFITTMRRWPSEVRLVHGEARAKQQLREGLMSAYAAKGRRVDVLVPER
ncbi:MBL fold metallo-hydrolase RNA specificity domain-containing protein [Stutzerimonas kunmingensis]|uniref:MBL fold metallo-hydrolase RNA specificity domain-containing protein n=1 Tax=Stutzerimonas kunmingensis TaxID=1211807 RepID=UPI00241F402D|nr:MBL fold metallo-hydrolase [Stutzerimonas kunmingensis]